MPKYIDAGAVERFLKKEIAECERDMKESCGDEFFEAAVDCRETAFRQVLNEIRRMPSRWMPLPDAPEGVTKCV